MNHMRRLKRMAVFSLILVFLVGVIPVNAETLDGNDVTKIEITSISKPNEVTQGDDSCGVSFAFEMSKTEVGKKFSSGDTIDISTNLGTLFDADWNDFSNIEIKGSDNQVLAIVKLTGEKITVTIQDAADGVESLSGNVSSVNKLTAKDQGATEENPSVTKSLVIGEKSKDVTFKWKEPYKPEDGTNLSSVDIAISWKNAWAINNNTGATTSIEVNPIASMELYGSYTWPESGNPNTFRGAGACENFVIKDVIEEQGYIDQNSVKIYAVVPKLAVRNTDANFNGYQVPAGTYYAARQGTMRYRIDKATEADSGQERVVRLTQKEGETYDEFAARIYAKGLQWGIYYDKNSNTETFLCNFGGVGFGVDEADKNNGIKYSDYGYDKQGASLGEKNFWSDNGPTAGNIVSYYIEYNAYYPEVVGEKTVSNKAEGYNVVSNAAPKRISGNTASFTINNGDASGKVRRRTLNLKLVDSDDPTKTIEGASFKVQAMKNGAWSDTDVTAVTDEKGEFSVGPFPDGEYRLVQTSTADGYTFNNNTYGETGNTQAASTTSDGAFLITSQMAYGVDVLATNAKIPEADYRIEYYKEQTDGSYALVSEDTQTFTKRVGTEVSVEDCPVYSNYHINKEAEGTVWSGTVSEVDDAGNGLVLKVYYDLDLHNVTYDLNGGTPKDVDYHQESVKHGTDINVKTEPARLGYIFEGWSDGTKVYQPGESITVTEDIILKALWKEDISYNDNDVPDNDRDRDDQKASKEDKTVTAPTKTDAQKDVSQKTTSKETVKKSVAKTDDFRMYDLWILLLVLSVVGIVVKNVVMQIRRS